MADKPCFICVSSHGARASKLFTISRLFVFETFSVILELPNVEKVGDGNCDRNNIDKLQSAYHTFCSEVKSVKTLTYNSQSIAYEEWSKSIKPLDNQSTWYGDDTSAHAARVREK